MKRCAMLGMLMLALVSPVAAQQPTQASEVVMQSLYKRLASTRSAVLLDAASDNAAVLGHVYMYDRPRCILSAPEVLKRGLPVSMQTYDTPIDVSDITLVSREAKQTGSYTVSSHPLGDGCRSLHHRRRQHRSRAAPRAGALRRRRIADPQRERAAPVSVQVAHLGMHR